MKRFVSALLIISIIGVLFSSCRGGRETCPAYSKVNGSLKVKSI